MIEGGQSHALSNRHAPRAHYVRRSRTPEPHVTPAVVRSQWREAWTFPSALVLGRTSRSPVMQGGGPRRTSIGRGSANSRARDDAVVQVHVDAIAASVHRQAWLDTVATDNPESAALLEHQLLRSALAHPYDACREVTNPLVAFERLVHVARLARTTPAAVRRGHATISGAVASTVAVNPRSARRSRAATALPCAGSLAVDPA